MVDPASKILAALAVGLWSGMSAPGAPAKPNQLTADTRISVGGTITNTVVVSGRTLGVTLFVTNTTGSDLYVAKHFNCNNYSYTVGDTSGGVHGDSWATTFADFVRLRPHQVMKFTHCFSFNEEPGEGVFSVQFYNNLAPEVERQLNATGIPFVIGLAHSFGKIRVQASNPAGAGNGSAGVPLHSLVVDAAVPDQQR